MKHKIFYLWLFLVVILGLCSLWNDTQAILFLFSSLIILLTVFISVDYALRAAKKEETESSVPVLAFDPIPDNFNTDKLQNMEHFIYILEADCVREASAVPPEYQQHKFWLTNYGRESAIAATIRFKASQKTYTGKSLFSLRPKERCFITFAVSNSIPEYLSYDFILNCQSIFGDWIKFSGNLSVSSFEGESSFGICPVLKIEEIHPSTSTSVSAKLPFFKREKTIF